MHATPHPPGIGRGIDDSPTENLRFSTDPACNPRLGRLLAVAAVDHPGGAETTLLRLLAAAIARLAGDADHPRRRSPARRGARGRARVAGAAGRRSGCTDRCPRAGVVAADSPARARGQRRIPERIGLRATASGAAGQRGAMCAAHPRHRGPGAAVLAVGRRGARSLRGGRRPARCSGRARRLRAGRRRSFTASPARA